MNKLLISCSLLLFTSSACASPFPEKESPAPSSMVQRPSPRNGLAQARLYYEQGNYDFAELFFLENMTPGISNGGVSPQDYARAIVSSALQSLDSLNQQRALMMGNLVSIASMESICCAFIELFKARSTDQTQAAVSLVRDLFLQNMDERDFGAYMLMDSVRIMYARSNISNEHIRQVHGNFVHFSNNLGITIPKESHRELLEQLLNRLAQTLPETYNADLGQYLIEQCKKIIAEYEHIPGPCVVGYLDTKSRVMLADFIWCLKPVAGNEAIIREAIAYQQRFFDALFDENKKIMQKMHINILNTAYCLLGDYQGTIDLLEMLPEDLMQWDDGQLIFAINSHLNLNHPLHTRPYVQALISMVKENKNNICNNPKSLSDNSFAAKMLAFSGYYHDAKALIDIMTPYLEAPSLDADFRTYQKSLAESLLFYMDVQKALNLTSPKALANALRNARKSDPKFINICFTPAEMTQLYTALYLSWSLENTPQSKVQRAIIRNILRDLQNNEQEVNTLKRTESTIVKKAKPPAKGKKAMGKGPAKGKVSTPAEGAARLFLKQQYCTYASKSLEKLFSQVNELVHISSHELSERHAQLVTKLARLKEETTGPTAPTAEKALALTSDFNKLKLEYDLFQTLLYDTQQEMTRARRALARRLAASEAPLEPLQSSSFMANLRGDFGHKKGSSPQESHNSASSSMVPLASSSSSDGPASSNDTSFVEIVYSKPAKKDLKTLKALPGMEAKLARFIDEIKADPYLVRMDAATGRAEALRVDAHVYSRRFDKKNRLVYSVTTDAQGVIKVEILSLLSHYEGLHLR